MSLHSALLLRDRRERSRSRFHVVCALAGTLLLAGCNNHFGWGISELAADRGWQPLPIQSWVLNDGLAAKAMSFCPRAACTQQGFAALITLEGREADVLERTLAEDPARLARKFAKPAADDKGKEAKQPAKPIVAKSDTTVSRFADAGAQGLLVEIRARDKTGKRAFTAILSGRSDARLVVAVGVSPEADAARSQALAAWRDR